MSIKLVRVYDNGAHIVAEFEHDGVWFDSKGQPRRRFTLNAENLEDRMANLEQDGRDVSVERHALSLIRMSASIG